MRQLGTGRASLGDVRQYLPPLMKSHGHLLDDKRRAKLIEDMAQYNN
jgi:hypothetical protein